MHPGGSGWSQPYLGSRRQLGCYKKQQQVCERGSYIVPSAPSPHATGHPGWCPKRFLRMLNWIRAALAQSSRPPFAFLGGLRMFWWPWADIYPCPGAAWKRARSAWRYLGSRGLAERVWLCKGAAGETAPSTRGRAPREPAEPRAQLRPCWCLVLRWRMLLAAGGADSPGTGRTSQGKW